MGSSGGSSMGDRLGAATAPLIADRLPELVAAIYSAKRQCSCGVSLGLGQPQCRCPLPLQTWPRSHSPGGRLRDAKLDFLDWVTAHPEHTVQHVSHWLLHGAILTGDRVVFARPEGAFITTVTPVLQQRRGGTAPSQACEDVLEPGRLLGGRTRARLQATVPISTNGSAINRREPLPEGWGPAVGPVSLRIQPLHRSPTSQEHHSGSP